MVALFDASKKHHFEGNLLQNGKVTTHWPGVRFGDCLGFCAVIFAFPASLRRSSLIISIKRFVDRVLGAVVTLGFSF